MAPPLFFYLIMGRDGQKRSEKGGKSEWRTVDFDALKRRCDTMDGMDDLGSLSCGKPLMKEIPPHYFATMRFFFHSITFFQFNLGLFWRMIWKRK